MSETGMTQVPLTVEAPERTCYSFEQMYDTGLLWLINRVIFHPRGLALALDGAHGEPGPLGWSIHAAATNGEPMTFDLPDGYEAERFRAIESIMAEAKATGSAPGGSFPAFRATEPSEETP